MPNKKSTFIVIACLCAITRVNIYPAEPDPELKTAPFIFPKIGIGNMRIGETAESVISKLNEKADMAGMEKTTNELLLLYKARMLLFVCTPGDKDDVLKCIISKTPAFLIGDSNVRIGSTLAEIRQTYENGVVIKRGILIDGIAKREPVREYQVCTIKGIPGIAFTLYEGKVISISVYKDASGIVGAGLTWDELLRI